MKRAGVLSSVLIAGACFAACGSDSTGGFSGDDSGSSATGTGGGDDSNTTTDGATPLGDSGNSSTGDSGASDGSTQPGVDSAAPGWDGNFHGPITCSGTGNYKNNPGSACGTSRWSVKTGSDSAASQVDLNPTLSSVASLVALDMGSTTSSSTPRLSTEKKTYAVKDANLLFARLEDDGDYHLVTRRTEVEGTPSSPKFRSRGA